jgi:pimeloyl-ACP methyl ester carboxylesterase
MGNISQMAAGLTHRVTPEQLRTIGRSVPKVTIVTGDEDHLVRPWRSRELKRYMPEAELVEWTGTGHAIHLQRRKEFNALVERTAREGVQRVCMT